MEADKLLTFFSMLGLVACKFYFCDSLVVRGVFGEAL